MTQDTEQSECSCCGAMVSTGEYGDDRDGFSASILQDDGVYCCLSCEADYIADQIDGAMTDREVPYLGGRSQWL